MIIEQTLGKNLLVKEFQTMKVDKKQSRLQHATNETIKSTLTKDMASLVSQS